MEAILITKTVDYNRKSQFILPQKISNVSSKIRVSKTQSTWFHDLPSKILINIFSYFSEEELQKYIIPVCQKWMYTALQPELWKSLKITRSEIPLNYIYYKIRRFSNLQRIVLKKIEDPRPIIRHVCRCLPNLKELEVKQSNEIPEMTLLNVIHCCKKLEKINLSGTPFKANRFYNLLSLLSNLRSLNLSKNPYLTAKKLTSCVVNCTGLEEFRLSRWISPEKFPELDDEDIAMILLNLAPNLKSLTLDCSNLTTKAFNKILTCHALERLSLHRALHLDGEIFTNFFKFFPNLKILKVRHASQLSNEHIQALFSNGGNVMKKLETFDISGNWQIRDDSLKLILNCCQKLKHLCLQSCKRLSTFTIISDANITSLKYLNVAFCTNMDLNGLEKTNFDELVISESQRRILNLENFRYETNIWILTSEFKKELKKATVVSSSEC